MMTSLGICSGPFMLFFSRETLGLSMEFLGKLFAAQGALTAILYIPMGWICDRFTPFRIYLALQPISLLLTILTFFFLRDERSMIIFAVIGAFVSVPSGLASSTITMELFPSSKFGQFFAAQNLFSMGIRILGNYLIGLFMDMTHSNYRMVFVWNGLFALPIFFMSLLVYRQWKHYGGPLHYEPPLPPEYDQPLPDPAVVAAKS